MNILIAEDQETTRSIVVSRLRNWGHNIVDVNNGQEALDYISQNLNSVDILLTDWDMPIMNGITLAEKVRKLTKKSQYIYIILFTVKSHYSDFVKGFTDGQVDDYLVKPYSAAQLRLHLEAGNRLISIERKLREQAYTLEKKMYEQIEMTKATQEEIISRLFSALESKDNDTARHVERIGIMSACLGSFMKMSSSEVEMIRSAAPLHDIGKIGISDLVLLKNGKLTNEEFRQIQEHTTIGARILSGSSNPTIQMAERIALYHHEHWDGSGYPYGLKGRKIPLEAQIVSIVDVYDALLSDRVYRRGLLEKRVMDSIVYQSNKKFDPVLVNVFVDNIEKIKNLCWDCLIK